MIVARSGPVLVTVAAVVAMIPCMIGSEPVVRTE